MKVIKGKLDKKYYEFRDGKFNLLDYPVIYPANFSLQSLKEMNKLITGNDLNIDNFITETVVVKSVSEMIEEKLEFQEKTAEKYSEFPTYNLEALEKIAISRIYDKYHETETNEQMASHLGISVRTFYRKVLEYDIHIKRRNLTNS